MAAEAFVVEPIIIVWLAETLSVRSKGKERCLKLARRLGLQFVGTPNFSRNESVARINIVSSTCIYRQLWVVITFHSIVGVSSILHVVVWSLRGTLNVFFGTREV